MLSTYDILSMGELMKEIFLPFPGLSSLTTARATLSLARKRVVTSQIDLIDQLGMASNGDV